MLRFLIILGSLTASALPAVAQYSYPPFPIDGGWRGSSTIVGSELHGMSDLVRSSGYANLLNSEAAINAQQARSLQLDNRLKYAETYYERRRIREEARNYNRNLITPEQVVRLADMSRPNPLNESQYNPSTGEIQWPLAAMQPTMDGTRQRIEHLFQERLPDGKLEPSAYFEIVRLVGILNDQLMAELDNLPMQEVSQAKAFLRSLSFEARKQAG